MKSVNSQVKVMNTKEAMGLIDIKSSFFFFTHAFDHSHVLSCNYLWRGKGRVLCTAI